MDPFCSPLGNFKKYNVVSRLFPSLHVLQKARKFFLRVFPEPLMVLRFRVSAAWGARPRSFQQKASDQGVPSDLELTRGFVLNPTPARRPLMTRLAPFIRIPSITPH